MFHQERLLHKKRPQQSDKDCACKWGGRAGGGGRGGGGGGVGGNSPAFFKPTCAERHAVKWNCFDNTCVSFSLHAHCVCKWGCGVWGGTPSRPFCQDANLLHNPSAFARAFSRSRANPSHGFCPSVQAAHLGVSSSHSRAANAESDSRSRRMTPESS